MVELQEYKDFFNKSEKERVLLQEKQEKFIWEEDRKIAKYLGTKEIYLIAIIRNTLRLYNLARYKQAREQELEDEEKILFEQPIDSSMQIDDNQYQNTKAKPKNQLTNMEITLGQPTNPIRENNIKMEIEEKNVLNHTLDRAKTTSMEVMQMQDIKPEILPINTRKTESTLCKRSFSDKEIATSPEEIKLDQIKKALIESECGTPDYGIKEKIAQSPSTSSGKRSKRIFKKPKHYEDIYNSIWASKRSIAQLKCTNTSYYNFTLWDLSLETSAEEIKNYLKFFGTATIISWQHFNRTKAAHIRIYINIKTRENSLKENWSLHLSQGKTYRTTPGIFDHKKLEERSKYKATIYNVSNTALDSLLLRQLKDHKVQAVHILSNRHGNRCGKAQLYFETEEDLVHAQSSNIYYFDTKLEWRILRPVRNIRNSSFNQQYKNKDNMIIKEKHQLDEPEITRDRRWIKKPKHSKLNTRPIKIYNDNKENHGPQNMNAGNLIQRNKGKERMLNIVKEDKEDLDRNLWCLLNDMKSRFVEIERQIAQRS